jgi:hypothetical protein
MDLRNLPQEIGSRIEIPTGNYDLRRAVEGRGFFVESSGQTHDTMRRDFANDSLRTSRAD